MLFNCSAPSGKLTVWKVRSLSTLLSPSVSLDNGSFFNVFWVYWFWFVALPTWFLKTHTVSILLHCFGGLHLQLLIRVLLCTTTGFTDNSVHSVTIVLLLLPIVSSLVLWLSLGQSVLHLYFKTQSIWWTVFIICYCKIKTKWNKCGFLDLFLSGVVGAATTSALY